MFLLRLSPLVPFNLLNYTLGLTRLPLSLYVVSSWAGMLPGTFAYVYLGRAGRAAVDAAVGASGVGNTLDVQTIVLYGKACDGMPWTAALAHHADASASHVCVVCFR